VLSRARAKAKRYSYQCKYPQIKLICEWKASKAQDIRDKTASKIEREMRAQKKSLDLFANYPEIFSSRLVYPKRLFVKYLN
jgi:hypothetical protein